MDTPLTETLQSMLSDPETVAKLRSIADTLGKEASPAESSVPPIGTIPLPRMDGRVELLRALRPLVRQEKQQKLDELVQIATVATMLGSLHR